MEIFIVSTPIGTLKDLSQRAIDILSTVDFIACEDTRITGSLLKQFNITNSLVSMNSLNEEGKIEFILNKLEESGSKKMAIVSDAGTPCIRDPGSYLINEAHNRNIKILTVPGPSSLVSAVAASGFIEPRIIFSGFMSKKESEVEKEIEIWKKTSPCIAVFFESPQRVLKTLTRLNNIIPTAEICISREISKMYEEHIRGSVEEVITKITEKDRVLGEFTITVRVQELQDKNENLSLDDIAAEAIQYLNSNSHIKTKQAVKDFADKYSVNSKELYKLVENHKSQEKLPC